jgi:hypothetical protein
MQTYGCIHRSRQTKKSGALQREQPLYLILAAMQKPSNSSGQQGARSSKTCGVRSSIATA